ncbi:unnamed protein product [Candida verbasci]|uniref:Uncharacterized protein n=1 Tax=Candida verbasci TaxID=1227364 RepID=A0A9W4TSC3_9ASCO|nr:unnamed protein product [Candida verbasci]
MDEQPQPIYLQQYLRSCIINSIDSFNYKNAEFLSERLLSVNNELDSIYLYCLSLYKQQKIKSCYFKLINTNLNHLGCSFLFAKCCLELGKYKEGIYQLIKVENLYEGIQSKYEYENNRDIIPDSSAIYHLLGDLYKSINDVKNSGLNYTQSLKLNQFNFEAFQELCKLGVNVRVKSIFKSFNDLSNPFNSKLKTPTDEFNFSTPRIKTEPLKKSNLNTNNDFEFTKPTKNKTYSKITSRLISAPQETPKKRTLKRNQVETVNTASTSSTNSSITTTKEIEKSEKHLLKLITIFAKGFKSMCKYDCYKAIRILESLNETEKNSPWVLAKLGRLHYEIVNYKQSEYYFNKLRSLDRTRLEDMEYFSTLLWHLHKKVELTYLANELHDLDSQSPITWCTIGNLFSLTHEPDEAIRCFNKAIKLDKKFTYAYTLKGHEYFGNDNYETALENFRISLLLDPRHYNALYGIGMVYINLGDYEKADYHFRKAVSINPINIILICCVGMVLEKLNKKSLALKQYELANKLQPLNPLPIFKKAQLLFSQQQYNLALKNFEILKDLAPDEASVHFLLGQLYNIQNDKFFAIKEFTIALNLDPKGNYLIREAMESLKDK